MKTILVLLMIFLVVGVFLVGLDKGWLIKTEQQGTVPSREKPKGVLPKGVLPMEMEVLNWLQTNGCKVEIPSGLSNLYKIYEKGNRPHDKSYEISWRVEFNDVEPAMNPGDPTPPRPGASLKRLRYYTWDSGKNTYDDLRKIKKDFQTDFAGGFVVK